MYQLLTKVQVGHFKGGQGAKTATGGHLRRQQQLSQELCHS